MKVDWPTCAERRHLSKAVTEAIKGVFIATADLDAAIKAKLDSTNLSDALATARKAESKAVDALHGHRNAHGC
jgi:hypothetical protein